MKALCSIIKTYFNVSVALFNAVVMEAVQGEMFLFEKDSINESMSVSGRQFTVSFRGDGVDYEQ